MIIEVTGVVYARNDHTTVTAPPGLLSEVKHCQARLVLRWGTTLESLVLFFCFFCQASCSYLVPCPHGASKICKNPAMLEFLVLFFCFFLSSKLRLSGPGIYIKFPEYYCGYRSNRGSLCQERPYHSDSTASRLLSEVKHCRARLVLRWGTTLESLVLFFCFFLSSKMRLSGPGIYIKFTEYYFKFPEYYCDYRGKLRLTKKSWLASASYSPPARAHHKMWLASSNKKKTKNFG